MSRIVGLQAFGAMVLSHGCQRLGSFGWWVGSKTAVLGLRSIVQPILGRYLGLTAYTCSSLMVLVIALLCGSASTMLVRLTWTLPGIVAGYVLRKDMKWLGVIISACAIALFVAHPEGNLAWQYSLYWCAPLMLCLCGADDMVSRSLSATLVAHAVGSVLWIYATDMSAVLWLSLIPRVAYERGFLTMGLIVTQCAIEGGAEMIAVLRRIKARLGVTYAS